MLLVDTNVIAPLYVRSARSHSVAELFARDAVWQTEPLALIELSNVLVSYERARYITAASAGDCVRRDAAIVQPNFFRGIHQSALETALRYRVTNRMSVSLAEEFLGKSYHFIRRQVGPHRSSVGAVDRGPLSCDRV